MSEPLSNPTIHQHPRPPSPPTPQMTGMLLDRASGALITALLFAGMKQLVACMAAPTFYEDAWAQACYLALVWWALVLISFAPAWASCDKAQWNTPWTMNGNKMIKAC